jgi:hypothetical protein
MRSHPACFLRRLTARPMRAYIHNRAKEESISRSALRFHCGLRSEGAGNREGDTHIGNQDTPRSEADAALEREILKERKFTLAEAIGRLAGPGAMKGESPVPRMRQAEIEIES